MAGDYHHKEQARVISYLKDAAADLDRAENALHEDPADSLFHSRQCVEKLIKACLSSTGLIVAQEHKELPKLLNSILPDVKDKFKSKFEKILADITKVMWYFTPTRYSVTKSGEVYLSEFTEIESKRSFKIALDFLELCFGFIEDYLNSCLAKEKGISLEEAKKRNMEIKLPKTKEKLAEYLKSNYSDVIRSSSQ